MKITNTKRGVSLFLSILIIMTSFLVGGTPTSYVLAADGIFVVDVVTLTYTNNDDGTGVKITGITCDDSADITGINLVIPKEIDEKPVVEIAANAYQIEGNVKFNSISLPPTIDKLGERALCSPNDPNPSLGNNNVAKALIIDKSFSRETDGKYVATADALIIVGGTATDVATNHDGVKAAANYNINLESGNNNFIYENGKGYILTPSDSDKLTNTNIVNWGGDRKWSYTTEDTNIVTIADTIENASLDGGAIGNNCILEKEKSGEATLTIGLDDSWGTAKVDFPLIVRFGSGISIKLPNSETSKTYGDASFNLEVTGLDSLDGHTFVSGDTGILTFNGTEATIVGVGEVTVKLQKNGTEDVATLTFTVNPKELTATVGAGAGVGLENLVIGSAPTFTTTLEGVIEGDTDDASLTGGSYVVYKKDGATETRVGTFADITTAGEYVVRVEDATLTGTKAGNYELPDTIETTITVGLDQSILDKANALLDKEYNTKPDGTKTNEVTWGEEYYFESDVDKLDAPKKALEAAIAAGNQKDIETAIKALEVARDELETTEKIGTKIELTVNRDTEDGEKIENGDLLEMLLGQEVDVVVTANPGFEVTKQTPEWILEPTEIITVTDKGDGTYTLKAEDKSDEGTVTLKVGDNVFEASVKVESKIIDVDTEKVDLVVGDSVERAYTFIPYVTGDDVKVVVKDTISYN